MRLSLFACVLSLASFALAGCATETEDPSTQQELKQAAGPAGVAGTFDEMRREQASAPSIAIQNELRGDAVVMPGASPAGDLEHADLDLARERSIVDGVVREAPLH